MTTVFLDAIEHVEISSNDHANEVGTLRTLFRGLHQLYGMIKRRELDFEHQIALKLEPGQKLKVFAQGLDYDGTSERLDAIACFFHWFGVSLCNFARLVGYIRGVEKGEFARSDLHDKTNFKTIKEAIDAYVASIPELANVLVWRNKVFGHFAITDPRKDDNIATLDMSVIFPVTFENRYFVGGLTMTKGNATSSHTSQLPRWSVTEVFEALIPRFWSDFKIPTVERLQDAIQAHSGHGANI